VSVWFRKPKLPASKTPELESGERVVAWTPHGADAVVVTNRGLFLPGRSRLRWHEIHKATWRDGTLTVVPADTAVAEGDGYQVVEDMAPVSITLSLPGDVPKRVRERVTGSVAYTSHHALPGGGAARVVARRASGRDGLAWAVRFEGGSDPDDPSVRAATAELVAAAKASLSQPD
jgi:hypothetical protein